MSRRIFISHAMKDSHIVEGIKIILEENGITTAGEKVEFIDTFAESFNTGESIRDRIKEDIKSSSEVVVVASEKSLSSQWVNYEIGMADALGKPIVVVGRIGSKNNAVFANIGNIRVVDIGNKAFK